MDETYKFPSGFLPGPLPCLPDSYQHEILEQGKGTDDHLLPLGDSFFFFWHQIRVSLCESELSGTCRILIFLFQWSDDEKSVLLSLQWARSGCDASWNSA